MIQNKETIFILSISSDIGMFLAKQYLNRGCRVIGTYRSPQGVRELGPQDNCELFLCDISRPDHVKALEKELKKLKFAWDTFISCAGSLLPAQPFFEADFKEWKDSVQVNSIAQLAVLHMLYPKRNQKRTVNAVFFSGGGANNMALNISAYAVSKIMLTKMCEYLDVENQDMNFFTIGPGWTKTKMHQSILNDARVAKRKYDETKEFVDKRAGTSFEEIFQCIDWLCQQGKTVASGRNFSVVYDPWRFQSREKLLAQLKADGNMYKLRRHNNDFLQEFEKI